MSSRKLSYENNQMHMCVCPSGFQDKQGLQDIIGKEKKSRDSKVGSNRLEGTSKAFRFGQRECKGGREKIFTSKRSKNCPMRQIMHMPTSIWVPVQMRIT